jgi:AmmeMemoRadiSam system protein A
MTAAPRLALPESDRRALLALARASIEAWIGRSRPPAPEGHPIFYRVAGAFVTLMVNGDLRGCIGVPEAEERLGDVIRRCAVSAASQDPRFAPISVVDLFGLSIEISVLSDIVPVADVSLVDVGRHGLVVSDGRRRGLLLPQVAVEHGWDREQFLAHACLKAGLQRDAWRQGADVAVFEAEVFREPR